MGLLDKLFGKKQGVPKEPAVSQTKMRAQPITVNPRIPNINIRQASRLTRLYMSKDTPDVVDAIEVCQAKLRAGGIKRVPRSLAEANKLLIKLQEV